MQPRRWLVSSLVVLTVAASLTGAVAHASAGVAARAPLAVDGSAPAPSARSSTVVLEGGSGGYQFAVATNGKGKTVVAWTTKLPSFADDVYRPGELVQAVLRTAKGRWGRVHTLGRGWGPLVGIDAVGDVTVVWQTHREGWTDGVRAVRRPAGGRWGTPVELSRRLRAPGYHWPGLDPYGGCDCVAYLGATSVRLAVNPRGLTVVSWSWGSEWTNSTPGYPDRVRVVVRPPGGRWSEPRSLSPRNDSYNQALAVGPGGRVSSLFARRGLLLVRERVQGEWTERVTLASIYRDVGVEVIAGPGGDATVVYQKPVRNCERLYCAALFAVSRPSGGPWSEPVRVAYERLEHGSDLWVSFPYQTDNILAGRGTGEVTTFWVTPTRFLNQVYVADRPVGGVFGGPELVGPLSEPDRDTDITHTPRSISVNEAGDVLVTTRSRRTGWWGSLRKAGTDTWSERFLLVPYGSVSKGRAAVTLTPTGDVVLVYVAGGGVLKGSVVDLP